MSKLHCMDKTMRQNEKIKIWQLKKSRCDKTRNVTTQNSKCDRTQNTQNMTKLQNWKYDKFKNSKCDNSKTQNVTKLKKLQN